LRAEPEKRLDPRAKLLWRLTGALQALPILTGGVLGSYVLSSRADMPPYLVVLPLLGALVLAVLFVVVLPPLLWRR
jgi:membrane protein YdbS with pleckstrin-like domain